MGKRKYTLQFKAEAVALVLERGVSATQAAKDLGIRQATLSRWVKTSQLAATPGALTSAEREELKQLRAETKSLRMEMDILRKADAFFAEKL